MLLTVVLYIFRSGVGNVPPVKVDVTLIELLDGWKGRASTVS